MIERGPSKEKNGEKGAYKGQNEGNRLSKKFCSTNIKKVPRAYEILNPALTMRRERDAELSRKGHKQRFRTFYYNIFDKLYKLEFYFNRNAR